MGKRTDFNCSTCGARHEHCNSGKVGNKAYVPHGDAFIGKSKPEAPKRGFFGQKKS